MQQYSYSTRQNSHNRGHHRPSSSKSNFDYSLGANSPLRLEKSESMPNQDTSPVVEIHGLVHF